jgi:putative transposase
MAESAAGARVFGGLFDTLRVKIRDEGAVRNKAVYLALGIAAEGTKDVLGIWIEQNEGASFG